ncbi:haloacid dehalogenase type II [Ornithinimicrobium faecis]|uniref:Haloacid dehalogenase type II n=1 Tax=Ornithinimicrobium faecis TaxID=2934158 RepID=A0ABY4YWD5_9MICO|nr:haloacid dehalogenase type II [Ornithinimicrobium sp. HY1793]USQ81053.1 haloacid dehalogenase type II [Ornithinimicrobium sp. HY1793]
MSPVSQTPQVLAFDTFGTVVDWHTGISTALARALPDVDASELAIAWRARYAPALARVEAGTEPWTGLDVLHERNLVAELTQRDLHLDDATIRELVLAWHRLPAWPEVPQALARLKERFIIAPLSNGSVALLTHLAKHAGLPWDLVTGSDLWGHYKPAPQTYLGLARLLEVEPGEIMMVAAHFPDLDAAKTLGLQTAYIARPLEFGPAGNDTTPRPEHPLHCTGIDHLADVLLDGH